MPVPAYYVEQIFYDNKQAKPVTAIRAKKCLQPPPPKHTLQTNMQFPLSLQIQ